MLGSGCFGIVRREGKYAVKHVHDKDFKGTLSSVREIDTLTKVQGSEYCLPAKEINVLPAGGLSIKMEAGVCDANRWCSKRVMLHAALGLEYLHKQNIIHGDVKMSNILVFDDYSAKLIDFGLSIQGPVSGLNLELYPEKLRAPEIRVGFDYTTACDVWAYGIVLLKFMKIISVLDYSDNFFGKLKAQGLFGSEISKMIFQEDPKKRATISEVIDSSYFSEFADEIMKARAKYNIKPLDNVKVNLEIEFPETKLPEAVKALAMKIATRAQEVQNEPNFFEVCLMIANKYYNLENMGCDYIVDDLRLEKRIVFDVLKGRIV